ncbi:MAG TPA: DUF2147 domain-containing protein [Bdellovibrionota bacterium]|jgi:uncharacterized protein (DUF2147 family)|nr:DUF2147 domain-containing protein [Bdellovibrionota bacterium]
MRALFILALSLGVSGAASAADLTDIAGKWRTIDDETNKPKSIVEITKVGEAYEGKVVQLFREPTQDQNPKCDKCKDERKDQPILGLKIIDSLKKRESDWGEGNILDPNNGKTYDVKMELTEGGQRLKVRGFLGFSLLGRTQTWERAN